MKIKKLVSSVLFIAFIFGITTNATAGGAAVCIASERKYGNGTHFDTDIDYVISTSSTEKGVRVDSEARRQHKKKYSSLPSCRWSDENIKSGYVVVIKCDTKTFRKIQYTRYGAGFGATEHEAELDAIECLEGRDWLWSKKRDGYTVVRTVRF